DPTAAARPLPDVPIGTVAAAPAHKSPAGGGGGGGGSPPPADRAASAPSPTPTKDAAARLATAPAAVGTAPTSASIVLPTSPRTMRLATRGINAIEKEKMPAVSARSIISLEPTKLFSTPFAPSTAFMLDRFTADIKT